MILISDTNSGKNLFAQTKCGADPESEGPPGFEGTASID
jgi:hypothetical protein